MGWPDLLSEAMAMLMKVDDNQPVAMNSPARTLAPMRQISNPVGYSQHHALAHAAVDHETVVCNSLIPNETTNHTQLAVVLDNWITG